jgi:hypothetical protein
LLLSEMIEAAERAGRLASGGATEQPHDHRIRSDAMPVR